MHRAIGFVTTQDNLEGRKREIFAARETRRLRRQAARAEAEKFTPEMVCNPQTAGAIVDIG